VPLRIDPSPARLAKEWLLCAPGPFDAYAWDELRFRRLRDHTAKTSRGRHSHSRCMHEGCSSAPEVECIWADGRGRAWFCERHFDGWASEDTDEGLPKALVKQRKVPHGVVGERYGEYPDTKTAAGAQHVVVSAKSSGQWPTDPIQVMPRERALDYQSVGVVIAGFRTEREAEGFAEKLRDAAVDVTSSDGTTVFSGRLLDFSEIAPRLGLRFVDRGRLLQILHRPTTVIGSGRRQMTVTRRTGKTAKATGRKTGDGHSVGLFIPLPRDLAKQFPSLGEDDDSPSHVTFLYIGEFKGRRKQENLLDVLRDCLRRWWPRCRATLGDLAYFDHHDKDRRVPHVQVDFDKDMSAFKHRLRQELHEAGIEVGDSFPEYKPHVTLAYMPGMDGEWEGKIPRGSWDFDEIEVWGLPEVHKIGLGPSIHKISDRWLRRTMHRRVAMRRIAKIAGWWAIEGPDNPGIWHDPPDDAAMFNGDGPADSMDAVLDTINLQYWKAWGRPAHPEELEAVFNFCMGSVRSDDARFALTRWFPRFLDWIGLRATEVALDTKTLRNLGWFFKHRPRHDLPWHQLMDLREEVLRVNSLAQGLRGKEAECALNERLGALRETWLDAKFGRDRVPSRSVNATHRRSLALVKWLSDLAIRLGVARDTYVVGGAVRNFIMGEPIKDVDVVIDTTRAGKDSAWLAQQVARAVPVPTNVTTNQYGVAILTVKGDWVLDGESLKGEVIEIANARKESYGGETGKGYKPHMVEPATVEEDVLRREFTFNTLLWRLLDLAHGPEKAEIVDLTGCGRRDLEERVLRCPRDPDVVFSDDPTRLLRAVKFTGKYGFKVPPDVVASVRRNAHKLKQMPWEAVGKILVNDILTQPTARRSLTQMRDLGLLEVVSEMIREQRPFATYMANQLRTDRRVQLLLDMMEMGIPASMPLSFLDAAGRQRLRELTVSMPEDEASRFVEVLIKPPVDSTRIISELHLEVPARAGILPAARRMILAHPWLADDPHRLTEEVIRQWT